MALCYFALQLNEDTADRAVMWLFEQGESYFANNMEAVLGLPVPSDLKVNK